MDGAVVNGSVELNEDQACSIDFELSRTRRDSNFYVQQHKNTDEIWGQVVTALSNSIEVQNNAFKLKRLDFLDPSGILGNQIDNYVPGTFWELEMLVDLTSAFRSKYGKNGTVQNFIGHLIVMDFQETAKTLGTIINNNNDGKSIQFYESVPQNNAFYGRNLEFGKLVKAISSMDLEKNFMVVISGSFGLGKSSLALNFGRKFFEMFDGNIIWINGESPITMERQFIRLAQNLSIPSSNREIKLVVHECYEYFENTKALFIFDNVENYSEISNYLPSELQKRDRKPIVLITSRDYPSWKLANVHIPVLQLDALSDEDALDFLRTELVLANPSKNDLSELSQELGNYPQAMRHASVYIKNLGINFSIQNYLQAYRKENDELRRTLEAEFTSSIDDNHTLSLLTTWNLIFPKLLEKFGRQESSLEEKIKFKILIFIGYGSPDFLPKDLLRDLNYGDTWDNILEVLENYSIIYSRGEVYTIHRAVQKVFRLFLPTAIAQAEAKLVLVNVFEELIQDINTLLTPLKYATARFKEIKTFLPTLDTFTSYIVEFGILFSQLEFVQNVWHFYNLMEFYEEALSYSNQMLSILETRTNPTDPVYLRFKYYYGISLMHQYEADKSQEVLEEVYAECIKPAIGQNDPLTIEVGACLAFVLNRNCKFEDSINLYHQVLEVIGNLKDPLNPVLRIRAKTGLAETQGRMGDHENSVIHFGEAIKDAMETLGPQDPFHFQILETQFLFCIAATRMDKLKVLQEACKIIQPLKKMIFATVGPNHIATLKAHLHYSIILMKLGRLTEAENVIDEIDPYAEKIVAPTNPLLIEFRATQSLVQRGLEKITEDELLVILMKNLQIESEALKDQDKHIYLIDSIERYGNALYDRGDYTEAKTHYEELYEKQLGIFGEKHQFTLRTKAKIQETDNKIPKPVQCPNCPKILKNQKTFNKHFWDKHQRPDEQKPQCPNCGVRLFDNYGVKRHLRETSCKGND